MVMVVLTVERAVVSTLAGGVSGTNGAFSDGNGTNAGFSGPWGVAVDASGNVFVADRLNQRIRKVTAGGGTRIGPVTLRACCGHIDVEALA
jgi:hypothetical protein